jgi:acetylornithine deacetylase/succinyl-diaminopimelate desuccinylase-like protein
MMVALDAIRAAAVKTKSTVKFVFDGEEEAGSPNLEKILSENIALFAGQLWLICDSPTHPSGRQQIVFGAPGLARVDITVYGARVELHGGHYGNWAPNPALALSRLIASMKDEQGRVLVEHFYDGIEPLSDVEKKAIAEAPDVDAQLMREFGLGARIGLPMKLAELITLPVLNIRGISSARVGAEAASVVPSTASASINLALMKGMDYRKTVARIAEHVRAQGFFVVDAEPSMDVRMAHEKVAMVAMRGGGYNATRTPMDLPISQELIGVVESARGPAVRLPTMGAAAPLELIERTLGTRTIVIPIANHDDNQHSFDENVRIQNLWDGIELMAALLTM